MDTRFESAQSWFLERLAARVVAVFEAMIGERPEVRCELASAPEAGGFLWRQAFGGTPGAVWIEASEKHWTEAGNQILVAAGIAAGFAYWLIAGWTAGFWKPVGARREAELVKSFAEVPRDAERVIFFPRAAGGTLQR